MFRFRYKVIADFLLFSHVLWIVLLIGGAVFIIHHRWYAIYHLVIVSGALLFNLFLGSCPLTRLEERYRKLWDPKTDYHKNSFTITYTRKIFRINLTPKQATWTLILINITSLYIPVLALTKII